MIDSCELPAGYLFPVKGYQSCHAICPFCAQGMKGLTPFWTVNVLPYNQSCYVCGTMIIIGGEGWCELMDGK